MNNNEFIKLQKFWKGKKIFLTGHSGFMGSWLVVFLDLLGAKVFGYSNNDYPGIYLYKIANLKKIIEKSINGDIRDYKKLKSSVIKSNAEILIHFAAQPLVKKSYIYPTYTYDVNVMGTVNVLNILKETKKIKAALVVTTDKVYNNNNSVKYFKESDKLFGNDPYSNSKACADSIASLYNIALIRKKKLAIARAGNVIGGGDNAVDRIVPDYIRCLDKNKILFLRYPKSIRPWQHVIEPLYGYLILLEKLFKKNYLPNDISWNFGPKKSNNKSVFKIISILNNFFNNKVKVNFDKKKKKKELYESKVLMLDSTKAKNFLSWRGILSLEETMRLIYSWKKEVSLKSNPLDVCRKQVLSYLKKI
jgi:CDP-glucose 4,6-dehydratase